MVCEPFNNEGCVIHTVHRTGGKRGAIEPLGPVSASSCCYAGRTLSYDFLRDAKCHRPGGLRPWNRPKLVAPCLMGGKIGGNSPQGLVSEPTLRPSVLRVSVGLLSSSSTETWISIFGRFLFKPSSSMQALQTAWEDR